MKTLITSLLVTLGLASPGKADAPVFREGDCWSYATRSGEEQSFLVIRKIETLPQQGDVIHISIFGVKIKNPHAPSGFADRIEHMPISGDALRNSVKQKVQRKFPDIDWAAGYRSWSEAQGGVFTEPVSACINFAEQAINQAMTHR